MNASSWMKCVFGQIVAVVLVATAGCGGGGGGGGVDTALTGGR